MNRIYDQPNHKHYGPVRRLHVMLLQLVGTMSVDLIERVYAEHHFAFWDHDLAWFLDCEDTEPEAQRTILFRLLKIMT